jgi:DNA-binding transcriptional regulator YhcF (GntR family)
VAVTRPRTPIDPSQIPQDVYPVVRVSTEFFLRGFDLLCQMHSDVVSGLVFMTIWQGQALAPTRRPMGIRELARKLVMPYETVRRHVRTLEQGGYCVVEKGGPTIPVQLSRPTMAFLRRVHGSALRVLGDLTRIGVTKFEVPSQRSKQSQRLSKKELAIATAATGLLLSGMKALRDFFDGDLLRGLVFTAIWTGNVKHVTNSAPAATRTVLADSQRLPISVLAVSNSLRLPYETVRRHVDALVKDGRCLRAGRHGVVVPATALREMAADAITSYRIVMTFVSDVRAAGVKV